MKNNEANRLIAKMRKVLLEPEAEPRAVVADLKTLRPFAIEEKDPLVTRVIRMAFQHIEKYGSFDIAMPDDEEEEEEAEEAMEQIAIESGIDAKVESLCYFLALLTNNKNKINRAELTEYKLKMVSYTR